MIQEKYTLIQTESSEFDELIESAEFVEVCLFNSASIFKVYDNKFLLTSKVASKYAILYNSREALDYHIQIKSFPVPEDDNIYRSESNFFKNISDSIYLYESHINKKFGFVFDNKKTTYNNICDLNRILQQEKNLSNYDIISLSIFISNLIVKRHDLQWKSKMIFTFNPTLYPLIFNKSKNLEFDVLGTLSDLHKESREADINYVYIKAVNYFEEIKISSNQYFERFSLPDDSDI